MCKELLEEELRLMFPMWKKTHDFKTIVIFETTREYMLEEVSELAISFTLGKGIFLGESNSHAFEDTLDKVKELNGTTNVHQWDLSGGDHIMGDRKARAVVIDAFKLSDDHYLLAARFQVRGDFAPFSGTTPIPVNRQAPTYHYQCMAEAFKRFRPLVAHDEVFLDIAGSKEGGRAYYLLEKGFRVIGVDHEKPAVELERDFKADYLHLDEDVMQMKAKDFTGLPPADWVVGYLKASARDSLDHLIDLLDDNDEACGLMLTITFNEAEDVKFLRQMIEQLKESNFSQVKTGLVPSYKKECFLMGTKDVGTAIRPRPNLS
jgi:hypothetical protein